MTEGRRGTPERPLSDLGKASYLNYWRQIILGELDQCPGTVELNAVADKYGLEPADIVMCLKDAGILEKQPNTNQYYIYLSPECRQLLGATLGRPAPLIDPQDLHWLPYDPFLGPFEYSGE